MNFYEAAGKAFDARPLHKWVSDSQVIYCSECQIFYDHQNPLCSGRQYAIRKNIPLRQFRRESSDNLFNQQQVYREKQQRDMLREGERRRLEAYQTSLNQKEQSEEMIRKMKRQEKQIPFYQPILEEHRLKTEALMLVVSYFYSL